MVAEFEEKVGFKPPPNKCRICFYGIAEEIDELLRRGATVAGLSQFLKSKGFEVGETSIRRHRDHAQEKA